MGLWGEIQYFSCAFFVIGHFKEEMVSVVFFSFFNTSSNTRLRKSKNLEQALQILAGVVWPTH